MIGLEASGDRRRRQRAAASRERRALEVGRAFAEVVRDEPAVRELWVTADTEEPGIHLWLITDLLDFNAERACYGAPSDQIDERFPGEVVWVHVLHARNTHGDVHSALRRDAEPIPLRAG